MDEVKGWVYVMTNEGFKNLVKIGYSNQDPKIRAKQLSDAGTPYPYIAQYGVLVDTPYRLEQATHKFLNSNHHEKEWFRYTVDEAKVAIKEVAKQNKMAIRYEEDNKPKPVDKTVKYAKKSHSPHVVDIFEKDEPVEQSTDFLKTLLLAKNSNAPDIQYKLGLMYQLGKDTNRDYRQAVEWYKKAATQGHIVSQVNLGCMFYNVSWLTKNYAEALKWFSKAAEQGNIEAYYYLGNMYQHGYGIKYDLKEAENYYMKAIENGDDEMKRKVIRACLNKQKLGNT